MIFIFNDAKFSLIIIILVQMWFILKYIYIFNSFNNNNNIKEF